MFPLPHKADHFRVGAEFRSWLLADLRLGCDLRLHSTRKRTSGRQSPHVGFWPIQLIKSLVTGLEACFDLPGIFHWEGGTRHRGQRILNRNPVWMGKRNNRIFVHGVSFLLGNWRLDHRQDTPPSHYAITGFSYNWAIVWLGGVLKLVLKHLLQPSRFDFHL